MGWIGALRMLVTPRTERLERRLLREREREVRARIRALPTSERRRLRALAATLRPLREWILDRTGEPRCCARCAEQTPWGSPLLSGGLCCSGSSEAIFSPLELAPLLLDGRSPGDQVIADPRAGCVFRGPGGCLLPAGSRPSICLGHLCRELAGELHARGLIRELLVAADELAARTRAIGETLGIATQNESTSSSSSSAPSHSGHARGSTILRSCQSRR